MSHTLRELRERRGWTQSEAADRMGVSRSHYVKLERNERGLTAHTIELAAKAFGVPMWQVFGEAGSVSDPALDISIRDHVGRVLASAEARGQARPPNASPDSTVIALRNRLVPIPVVGKAEAGAFREVDELEDTGEEPELIFDEPDPDFPKAKRVAFTVQGDSMNAAVPPLLDGYRLICVDFQDADVPLSDGMTVIVQRTRDGGLTREWSVKEVEMGETEIAFCPRSTNPRHKPIVVPIDAEPNDETKVEVIAIARSVSASIPRYRIKRP
ncbi:XRE family transcriptional regulator [Methylobacterium organophilum]|uniref:helix-turn-helix domain-containing protein n=1 Tax=Methylobacterium organophilum TaxID=410 RepID=UPI001F132D2E|nr:XRE family transcriptional regulator [Methylobacterium organophilum]UMY16639.1 XRE family transcriptional regulator [Methylobacterium organophilum]